MPITPFPKGISSFGIPVIPGADEVTAGLVFFVGNRSGGNGSDGNSGMSPDLPFSTIQQAINSCQAGRGDKIYVLPGHAETVTATSIALNISGVRIYGLGQGASRPVFTFSTAAATITVSAAGCRWDNCHFVANFLNVASAFTTAAAKDLIVSNSSFIDSSSALNFLCIVTTSAVDNAADGLTFLYNYVYGLAATDGAVISVLANLLRLNVSYNDVDKPGVTSDAGHLITMSSKVCGGVRIIGNVLTCVALVSQSTGTLFTGSSTTSSGICADNYVVTSDTTSSIIATTGTKISFSQNFMGGAADASGVVWPAADTPS